MKTTTEVLSGALAALRTHGWIRGDYGNEECGYCSYGAICAQADDMDVEISAWGNLSEAIGHQSVVYWNDAPGRTFEEVEAAFLRAIEIAEAEE